MLSVDKFGRWSNLDGPFFELPVGERGIGFLIDNRFDDTYLMPIDKRLLNVASPVDEIDCVNLRFLKDNTINNYNNNTSNYSVSSHELINVGLPFRSDEVVTLNYINNIYPKARGQYLSMKDRRIVEVGDPIDESDLINVNYLQKSLSTLRSEFEDVNQIIYKRVDLKKIYLNDE